VARAPALGGNTLPLPTSVTGAAGEVVR
jgi:hypothetical protein